MNEIKFVRVDHRLIHGQVVTKWLKLSGADTILVIDNGLSKDPFMSDIYKMAAPEGIDVEILSTSESVTRFKNGDYSNKKVFILFRNIKTLEESIDEGLLLEKIQIGGIPYEKGRTKVMSAISLLPEEIDFLETLDKKGVEIVAQVVPEESGLSFKEIKNKF